MATIMETMQLLSNQVKELTAKQMPADNQATKPNSRNENAKAQQNKRALHNKNKHYCWTHGCQASKDHMSATCKEPAKGHKTTAPYNNRMGGSNVWSL